MLAAATRGSIVTQAYTSIKVLHESVAAAMHYRRRKNMPFGNFSCLRPGSCCLGSEFCLTTAWVSENVPVQWGWVECDALDQRHGKIGTSAAELPADTSDLITTA